MERSLTDRRAHYDRDGAAQERPLRRVVVREELVDLTGDYVKAMILDYFLQRQAEVQDLDRYIREERVRAGSGGEEVRIHETGGWIYKDAEELSEEAMLRTAKSTVGRHVAALVDAGYLARRRNPHYRWDKTYQYRVDLRKVRADLATLGYPLEGWFSPPAGSEMSDLHHPGFDTKHRDSETEHRDAEEVLRNIGTTPRDARDETAIPERSTDRPDDLPSVDRSAREPEPQPQDRTTNGRRDKPWQAFATELERMPDDQIEAEAVRIAGRVTRVLDIRRERAERLAQHCVDRAEADMLVRVAERVAGYGPRSPWSALLASILNAREEEGGRSSTTGAARRQEGYEWLFAKSETDQKENRA